MGATDKFITEAEARNLFMDLLHDYEQRIVAPRHRQNLEVQKQTKEDVSQTKNDVSQILLLLERGKGWADAIRIIAVTTGLTFTIIQIIKAVHGK